MELTKTQKQKKAKGICVTPFCTKSAAKYKYKKKTKRLLFCHCCRIERYQVKYPEKYTWMTLRNNAKRRGKDFSLTFDQFQVFLKNNPDYMRDKGTKVCSLQIDRIDNEKGYHFDNIQTITLRKNRYKYTHVDSKQNGPDDEIAPW